MVQTTKEQRRKSALKGAETKRRLAAERARLAAERVAAEVAANPVAPALVGPATPPADEVENANEEGNEDEVDDDEVDSEEERRAAIEADKKKKNKKVTKLAAPAETSRKSVRFATDASASRGTKDSTPTFSSNAGHSPSIDHASDYATVSSSQANKTTDRSVAGTRDTKRKLAAPTETSRKSTTDASASRGTHNSTLALTDSPNAGYTPTIHPSETIQAGPHMAKTELTEFTDEMVEVRHIISCAGECLSILAEKLPADVLESCTSGVFNTDRIMHHANSLQNLLEKVQRELFPAGSQRMDAAAKYQNMVRCLRTEAMALLVEKKFRVHFQNIQLFPIETNIKMVCWRGRATVVHAPLAKAMMDVVTKQRADDKKTVECSSLRSIVYTLDLEHYNLYPHWGSVEQRPHNERPSIANHEAGIQRVIDLYESMSVDDFVPLAGRRRLLLTQSIYCCEHPIKKEDACAAVPAADIKAILTNELGYEDEEGSGFAGGYDEDEEGPDFAGDDDEGEDDHA